MDCNFSGTRLGILPLKLLRKKKLILVRAHDFLFGFFIKGRSPLGCLELLLDRIIVEKNKGKTSRVHKQGLSAEIFFSSNAQEW